MSTALINIGLRHTNFLASNQALPLRTCVYIGKREGESREDIVHVLDIDDGFLDMVCK